MTQSLIASRVTEKMGMAMARAGPTPLAHQIAGVEWMTDREMNGILIGNTNMVRGGMLCDEMGMGKTAQMLGLVLAHPVKRTLLVLPPSLISQWVSNIRKYTGHNPLVYYGAAKKAITKKQMMDAPIVITSYGALLDARKPATVLDEEGNAIPHPPAKLNPLFMDAVVEGVECVEGEEGVEGAFSGIGHRLGGVGATAVDPNTPPDIHGWDRVIFDEAHRLRNAKSRTVASVEKLGATHTWLVTGTPIQNTVRDIARLFGFIGVDVRYASTVDLMFMKTRLMIRRRHGVNALPPVEEELVRVGWGEDDTTTAMNIREHMGVSIIQEDAMTDGDDGAMVQAPVRNRGNDNGPPSESRMEKAKKLVMHGCVTKIFGDIPTDECRNDACPIGMDPFEDTDEVAVINGCQHVFKPSDLEIWFARSASCPMCRHKVVIPRTIADAAAAAVPAEEPESNHTIQDVRDHILARYTRLRVSCATSVSKIDMLIGGIIDASDNGAAKIVFTNFRSESDLLAAKLLNSEMDVFVMKREMGVGERSELIRNAKICARREIGGGKTVLMMNVRMGSEGLDLQEFSQIYFASPSWNPSVERQAVARCARLGQLRPVRVVRWDMRGWNLGGDGGGSINSMDEVMRLVLQRKTAIVSTFMEEDQP
jgi:superfamily II DNA or RNA helicase